MTAGRQASAALGTTLALWRAAHRRTARDRAYTVYAAVLVTAMTVPVVGRWLWSSVTAPAALTALAPTAGAPRAVAAVALALLGALIIGRVRGPVVMPPFLADTLGRSPLPRARVYARPFAHALVVCTAGGMLAALVPVTAWAVTNEVTPLGAMLFVACGGAVGSCVAGTWLAGQAVSGRTVVVVAAVIAAAVAAPIAWPALWPATPLGWLALTYAAGGTSPWAIGLIVVGVCVAAGATLLLGRLPADIVLAQSVRWQQATAQVQMLDAGQAAAAYAALPQHGRRLRAVGPRHEDAAHTMRIAARADAVVAARTPGRALAGVLALAAAGCLMAAAAVSAAAWIAVVGAVLAYAAVGPFTDGVRHAVDVAVGPAVYGVADGRLLLAHVVLPLVVAGVLLAVAAGLVAMTPHAVLGAALISPGAVGCRVLAALKGPMPVALLMPMSTPAGDVAAIARLAWASDTVILVCAMGAGVVLLPATPLLLVVSLCVAAGLGIHRWRRR